MVDRDSGWVCERAAWYYLWPTQSSAWVERICSLQPKSIEGGESKREGGMGRICKDFKEEMRNQRDGFAEGFWRARACLLLRPLRSLIQHKSSHKTKSWLVQLSLMLSFSTSLHVPSFPFDPSLKAEEFSCTPWGAGKKLNLTWECAHQRIGFC